MSLSLFSMKNNYHKNGIWWFTKIGARIVGEDRWEKMRLIRRVAGAQMWYTRQTMLYETFVEAPDVAALLGAFPKLDSSHGVPAPITYEMYRDFQENTPNSDGWFGMWFVVLATIYLIHFFYSYMLPYYWIKTSLRNEETTRLRMVDCVGTAVLEEIYGLQYAEVAWNPHDLAYNRIRGMFGYSNLDDPRIMHSSTFNRKHKYKEHYIERVGDQNHMSQVNHRFNH